MNARPLLALAAVCSVACLAGCTYASYSFRAEIPSVSSVDSGSLSALRVETRNGAIEVEYEAGVETVHVDATRFARGESDADARAHAELIEVSIERSAADSRILEVLARFPPSLRGRSAGVRFRISAPPSLRAHLETSNGKVDVTGARASVEVETSNGAISLVDARGDVRARTSNGKLILHDITGAADVETSNGAIEVEGFRGPSLRAVTSNGKVSAQGTRGNVKLRSSNGAIELFALEVPEEPEIDVETTNGSVQVELPPDANARLSMRTSNGRVSTDLAGVAVRDIDASKSRFAATLGNGRGRIALQSSNCSVSFRLRRSEEGVTAERAPSSPVSSAARESGTAESEDGWQVVPASTREHPAER